MDVLEALGGPQTPLSTELLPPAQWPRGLPSTESSRSWLTCPLQKAGAAKRTSPPLSSWPPRHWHRPASRAAGDHGRVARVEVRRVAARPPLPCRSLQATERKDRDPNRNATRRPWCWEEWRC